MHRLYSQLVFEKQLLKKFYVLMLEKGNLDSSPRE